MRHRWQPVRTRRRIGRSSAALFWVPVGIVHHVAWLAVWQDRKRGRVGGRPGVNCSQKLPFSCGRARRQRKGNSTRKLDEHHFGVERASTPRHRNPTLQACVSRLAGEMGRVRSLSPRAAQKGKPKRNPGGARPVRVSADAPTSSANLVFSTAVTASRRAPRESG